MKNDKLGNSHYVKMATFANQAKIIREEFGDTCVLGYDPTGVKVDVAEVVVRMIERLKDLEERSQ